MREKLLKDGVGLSIELPRDAAAKPCVRLRQASGGRTSDGPTGQREPQIVHREPVTSGLPLPEGVVEDVAQLRLVKDGKLATRRSLA